MKLNEQREHLQTFRLFQLLGPCHRSNDCKSKTFSLPNSGRRHNKLLHSDFSKMEATTGAQDATTAVATIITQGCLIVVRKKLVNRNHSLSVLAMCDTESSVSFVDKLIVSTLLLQDQEPLCQ